MVDPVHVSCWWWWCCTAGLSVGRRGRKLRPSLSTAALIPVRDRDEPPRPPPTSPTMIRSPGIRLGSAGLRRPLAVLADQSGGETRDHRPAQAARRPVTTGDMGIRRSLAARDALPKTSTSGTDLSSTSRVMSSRLKRRRRLSMDNGTRTATPAIHKVSRSLLIFFLIKS